MQTLSISVHFAAKKMGAMACAISSIILLAQT